MCGHYLREVTKVRPLGFLPPPRIEQIRGQMAIKKSQLYSRLLEEPNELHGSMGPTQYKDYVLTLLFVKYISDKDTLLEVPDGASFNDMVALKGDKEIGDKINKIIAKLAEENDLKGVIDQASLQ